MKESHWEFIQVIHTLYSGQIKESMKFHLRTFNVFRENKMHGNSAAKLNYDFNLELYI